MREGPQPAAWNMAVDEALLRLARTPTLRLYSWQPHAVSLGWFQRRADFADLPPGTVVVRRLTGGGAIHHGDELTFSLAAAPGLLPGDIAASYALLHDAALAALRAVGVAATRCTTGEAAT
ncbi:MAG: lipoyl protein ligase domain-containing protein, partial [Planctomycetota bacterium]